MTHLCSQYNWPWVCVALAPLFPVTCVCLTRAYTRPAAGEHSFSCDCSSAPGNTTSLTLLFFCKAREISRTEGGRYCCCHLHHWPLHCAREKSKWEFKMLSLFPRGRDAEKSICLSPAPLLKRDGGQDIPGSCGKRWGVNELETLFWWKAAWGDVLHCFGFTAFYFFFCFSLLFK